MSSLMFSPLFCCFRSKQAAIQPDNPQVKKTTSSELDYYDFLAPSVYHLQTSFLDSVTQAGLDLNSRVYDIEDLHSDTPGLIRQKGLSVRCPHDDRLGAAYVHCLEGDDHVGTATHMLSYAWGYEIGDIVETLVDFCKREHLDTKRTYIWICAFCNNQHRVVEGDIPFEDFKNVFNKRVRGIGNILAMMTPWDDPGYLKRVWCVFEMYTAHEDDNTSIQIIMPPKQNRRVMEAVMKPTDATGRNGLDELFAVLASTRVELADASKYKDKENILQLVREGPGYSAFNTEINVLLRKWGRDTVFASAERVENEMKGEDSPYNKRETATYITFCATFFSRLAEHQTALEMHEKGLKIYDQLDDSDAKELMARCHNNMGTEYESLGNYEEALKSHEKCREAFEEIYGEEHENTSVSYFNIGAVLRKLDETERALAMYEKSMAIDTKIKGENHIDVALSQSYIGRVKQSNGDYDGAQKLFESSLKIRLDTYGDEHPDAAIGYGDMGLLHHMRSQYDEAIKMHFKALVIQEQILGRTHPDTASIYQNIGGAYYEQGLYYKALEYHKKANEAYETSFGYDHPKTKTSREWIQIVEDAMQSEKGDD